MKPSSKKRPNQEAKGIKCPETARWAAFNQRSAEMAEKCRQIADRERRFADHPRTPDEDRETWRASADEWDRRAQRYDGSTVSCGYLQRLAKLPG